MRPDVGGMFNEAPLDVSQSLLFTVRAPDNMKSPGHRDHDYLIAALEIGKKKKEESLLNTQILF